MAQLPIMVSCPEHGCLLLPADIAVRHYRGAPEPATISTSAAVQVMDRRTHEGAPLTSVCGSGWCGPCLTRSTPRSRSCAGRRTRRRWCGSGTCIERPVRAGQTVPYEALDWDRQVAMLEAAATAMDLAGRGVIYPAGTLGPLLREEPAPTTQMPLQRSS